MDTSRREDVPSDARAGKPGFGGAGICAAAPPANKSHARMIAINR
jgi:hypothetical protein